MGAEPEVDLPEVVLVVTIHREAAQLHDADAVLQLVDDVGNPATQIAPGDTLIVRATYRAERSVERPVFQVAIIDVDTGLVVTTATSNAAGVPAHVDRDGAVECRFANLPLRPRQYVLRLAILDSHQLASYDQVTAGPRFAVTGHGKGVDTLADEEDGLVSLPYEFEHISSLKTA